MSDCPSLVTVANIDGLPVVQFSHFSIREYLVSNCLANAGWDHSCYHVLPHFSHTFVVRASLNVLLSISDHVDNKEVEEQQEQHPLVIYGAQHWVDHAKFGTVLLDIQDLLELLFDE